MINIIKKRMKEDSGNAVMVLGLILIIATLFVGGLLLDVTKAHQMKNSYVDSARKATQTAIRRQNTEGHLTIDAAGEAVYFYEKVARPSIIKDGYMSSCDENRNVQISIYFMDDNFNRGSHVATISNNQVYNSDDYKSIANKMRVNGRPLSRQLELDIQNAKYTGVEMELTETTPNVILPTAKKLSDITGEDSKCQKLGIKSGASQLIGISGRYE